MTSKPEVVGTFHFGMLLVECENTDLIARVAVVENHEPIELSDQGAVVEVAKLGFILNLAARIGADYATETKMTEAAKAGNMTPSQLRGMIQGGVIIGNLATGVIVGTLYFIIWILTQNR